MLAKVADLHGLLFRQMMRVGQALFSKREQLPDLLGDRGLLVDLRLPRGLLLRQLACAGFQITAFVGEHRFGLLLCCGRGLRPSPNELFMALCRNPCDVLVVDFSMPHPRANDGIAMLSQIRNLYPDLPMVMLSSVTNVAVLRAATEVGVLGLIDKAADLTDLPLAIDAVQRGVPFCSRTHERRAAEAGHNSVRRPSVMSLSLREAEVLRLIKDGHSVSDIAKRCNKSITTISRQKRDAMRKLGITTDAQLFSYLQNVS